MSIEMFQRVLELSEASGIKTIQFTGGEPTLNKQIIPMAMLAKGHGCNLILRTHGRNMAHPWDKETGAKWAEAAASTFDEIIVSIDGTAGANFSMRPVISKKKLLEKAGNSNYLTVLNSVAVQQFAETVSGYEALSRAVGTRKDVSLKVNSVVARANLDDMPALGAFLSDKVKDGSFRVDRWDFTQVYPSPESSEQERAAYVISEKEFLTSLARTSITSRNIGKRAKPNTSARCLIIDESGRTYFGGESNIELGSLGQGTAYLIAKSIQEYDNQVDLSSQRMQKYLEYRLVE
jgi:molybdenum cofactor biosynthesis enzyme MoaA